MGIQTSTLTMRKKVGNVVGSKGENGFSNMRIYTKPSNPKTEKQMKVRGRFKMITSFAGKCDAFLRIGMKSRSRWISKFVKLNWADGVDGTYPNYELMYNKLRLSDGNTLLGESSSVVIDSQVLTVSWTDNTGVEGATANDIAMVMVYNSVENQVVTSLSAGTRASRIATVTLPTYWSGDSVEVWYAMVNPETNEPSTSAYLGNFSL